MHPTGRRTTTEKAQFSRNHLIIIIKLLNGDPFFFKE
jgi:hypothetical protein